MNSKVITMIAMVVAYILAYMWKNVAYREKEKTAVLSEMINLSDRIRRDKRPEDIARFKTLFERAKELGIINPNCNAF